MRRTVHVLGALCALCLATAVATAQAPRTFSFQGFLSDASGNPVTDGGHTIHVRLYDAGGAQLYSETHSVTTLRGVFGITIGSVTPIPGSLTFDQPYFVGLSIDGGAELNPRTALTAVPYALNAAAVAGDAAVTSLNGATGDVTIEGGGGTTVNRAGNTITISSSGGGGGGIAGVQSPDGSITVVNPNGPTAGLSIAEGGVTLSKISTVGAASGNVLAYNGASVAWTEPAAGFTLPYAGNSGTGSDLFSVTASGAGVPVTGASAALTGSATGVRGTVASTSHGIGATGGATGVLGQVTPTTPGGYSAGVRGLNNGTGGTGIGVIGFQAGSGWGVYGETPNGFGVYGLTTNNAAASVGVRGETFSSNGTAVEAKYSGTGVGVALELDNGALRVTGTNKAAFVHTATPANKLSLNGTDVDNPMCNGDPTAILIVTQKLNPTGIVYNNSPIGVYYNTTRNKWEIFNENNVAIPNNAQFNVLVIKQ